MEWLVFNDQIGDRNRFANGFFGNPATPLARDLFPGQPFFELFQHQPDHNPCALEGRLTAANLRVGDNMAPQLNPPSGSSCLRFHVDARHYAPGEKSIQAKSATEHEAGTAAGGERPARRRLTN